MPARAYYNEIDPYAAEWLRNLIAAGHIPAGDVDERDIRDVHPNELDGYTQCHFFAGIGIWAYALRLAGWPDDRPVWTGSCPCQPFSSAGRGDGFTDERHLWPAWHHLIRMQRPGVVFGEQVASKDGLGWLDLVQADLEGADYASGAVDLCAAGVGAPHIRQRLWFVAERMGNADSARAEAGLPEQAQREEGIAEVDDHGSDRLLRPGARRSESGGMADSGNGAGLGGESRAVERGLSTEAGRDAAIRPGPTNGHWGGADWLGCRDGKWRPVESGTFPLAHGAPARVGRLRAYGNGIVAQAAKEVILAYLETSSLIDRRDLSRRGEIGEKLGGTWDEA